MAGQPGDEGAVPSGDPPGPAPDHDHDRLLARIDELLSLHAVKRAEEAVASTIAPAWRRRTPGERRTAVTIATVSAIALMVALPTRVANRPWFLVPSLALLMLVGLVIGNPGRFEHQSSAVRRLSLLLIAVLSLANAASGARLVIDLVRAEGIRNPGVLLATGAAIWLTNVIIFSLWYWDSDRGGPVQRALGARDRPDFLFTQMSLGDQVTGFDDWEPMYVDYLYLSFTNAAAFSPTDVLPLSRWAKLVMMLQSTISIVTIALVIARAVNVLN